MEECIWLNIHILLHSDTILEVNHSNPFENSVEIRRGTELGGALMATSEACLSLKWKVDTKRKGNTERCNRKQLARLLASQL